MMIEARRMFNQLLAAIGELIGEIRALRQDLANSKIRTGGE